jgi:hypothetical protein
MGIHDQAPHEVAQSKAEAFALRALIFLNLYEPETFLARLYGPTEKTFRKWCWSMIQSINQLYDKIVSNKEEN